MYSIIYEVLMCNQVQDASPEQNAYVQVFSRSFVSPELRSLASPLAIHPLYPDLLILISDGETRQGDQSMLTVSILRQTEIVVRR